jgi:hypothetical protein
MTVATLGAPVEVGSRKSHRLRDTLAGFERQQWERGGTLFPGHDAERFAQPHGNRDLR